MKKIFVYILIFSLFLSCFDSDDNKSDDVKINDTISEPASNVKHGYGTFSDPSLHLSDSVGNLLENEVHFEYDKSLLNGNYQIYDTGLPGSDLSANSYMRIVVNENNITDLGLNPVAKDLTRLNVPNGNEVYIDPVRGEFVLPQPIYWSRMESWENIIANADIIDNENPSTELDGAIYDESFQEGKYNNSLYRFAYARKGSTMISTRDIYPLSNYEKTMVEGTISFFARVYGLGVKDDYRGVGQGSIYLYLQNDTYIRIRSHHDTDSSDYYDVELVVNGTLADSASIINNHWQHYYIIWGQLKDNSTIIVYQDNDKILSSSELIEQDKNIRFRSYNYARSRCLVNWGFHYYGKGYGYTFLDNVKIWNHVVSEDPSWMTNEYALHPVYGEGNNYYPDISNENNGVSYFKQQ